MEEIKKFVTNLILTSDYDIDQVRTITTSRFRLRYVNDYINQAIDQALNELPELN